VKPKWPCLNRGAFTLTELLVVVAVIALVASLLLTTLANARFQARNVICKNQLRQITVALLLYVNDHSVYPPSHAYLDNDGEIYFEWDQLLKPFLFPGPPVIPFDHGRPRPVDDFFLCPFFVPKRSNLPFEHSFLKVPRFNYNENGVAQNSRLELPSLGLTSSHIDSDLNWDVLRPKAVHESLVRVPSDMIALGDPFVRSELPERDRLYQSDAYWRPLNAASVINDYPKLREESDAAVKIHSARFNKTFCDGHVETENFKKPFMASDENLRRWNTDNEPHRDRWNDGY